MKYYRLIVVLKSCPNSSGANATSRAGAQIVGNRRTFAAGWPVNCQRTADGFRSGSAEGWSAATQALRRPLSRSRWEADRARTAIAATWNPPALTMKSFGVTRCSRSRFRARFVGTRKALPATWPAKCWRTAACSHCGAATIWSRLGGIDDLTSCSLISGSCTDCVQFQSETDPQLPYSMTGGRQTCLSATGLLNWMVALSLSWSFVKSHCHRQSEVQLKRGHLLVRWGRGCCHRYLADPRSHSHTLSNFLVEGPRDRAGFRFLIPTGLVPSGVGASRSCLSPTGVLHSAAKCLQCVIPTDPVHSVARTN